MRIHQDNPDAAERIAAELDRLTAACPADAEIVLVCIGTDRSTGDSLGPLVGTLLAERGVPVPIYGTLDNLTHAGNLAEVLERVQSTHDKPWIIAVDASLGTVKCVGKIAVEKGPLRPGEGVDKKLPPVGEIAITGCVAPGGYMQYFVLQSTRLSLVYRMAQVIAQGVAIWAAQQMTLQEVAAD